MIRYKKVAAWLVLLGACAGYFALIAPVSADEVTITPDLPSVAGSVPVYGEGGRGPLAVLVNFYNLSLIVGGALAFAMVLYGAIKYVTTGGSHHAESEAREIITQSFLGLLLLVGAYLGLSIINPDLTNLQLPFMERLKPPPPSTGPIALQSWACIDEDDKKTVLACYISKISCERSCSTARNPFKKDGTCQPSTQCRQASEPAPKKEWGCVMTNTVTGTTFETPACFPSEDLCKASCGDPTGQVRNITAKCEKTPTCAARITTYGWAGATPPAGTLADADARARLRAKGIRVVGSISRDNDCQTAEERGCTSMMGIPESVVEGLIKIATDCRCGFEVTGGTEGGHSEHRMGVAIVDIEGRNPQLNSHIYRITGMSPPGSQGHLHCYPTATGVGSPEFMWEEYADSSGGSTVHWHVRFGADRKCSG